MHAYKILFRSACKEYYQCIGINIIIIIGKLLLLYYHYYVQQVLLGTTAILLLLYIPYKHIYPDEQLTLRTN